MNRLIKLKLETLKEFQEKYPTSRWGAVNIRNLLINYKLKIMQLFKCDGHNCKSENHELEVTNWLTIGSADGGSLFIKNQLPGNQFSIMDRYSDLHFCSIPCFIGKFFEDKEKAINEGSINIC